MRRRRRRGRHSRSQEAFQAINITPFTDVLLVLLIIFLIAGSSLAPTGVDVKELVQEPTVGETGAKESERETMLFVHHDGRLTAVADGKTLSDVTVDELETSGPINVTADRATPVEVVIKVYDELLLMPFEAVRLAAPQETF